MAKAPLVGEGDIKHIFNTTLFNQLNTPKTTIQLSKSGIITMYGFSYQRLQNETHEDHEHDYEAEMKRAIDHTKSRIRKTSRFQRIRMRKRLKMKIPSLRKFMKRRARVVMLSMTKVLKRLKESQAHFGDLFAGNYLFMQVNPSSIKPSSSPYKFHGNSIKKIEDDHHHVPCSSPKVS